MPLTIHAAEGRLTVTFSDPVESSKCAMKIWSLKRTKGYGSKHYDEHEIAIKSSKLSDDKRTLTLTIPDLACTQCYELKIGEINLHGTIHNLAKP